MKKTLTSKVKGFEGKCLPVWLNTNQIDNRQSRGVTGFFKLVKKWPIIGYINHGEEFHGIINHDGTVTSTEGIY